MTLFGYRVPMVASILVWCLLWEIVGRADLVFLLPPFSAVLVAVVELVQVETFQRATVTTLQGTEDAVHVVMTDHLIRREKLPGDPLRHLNERSTAYRGDLRGRCPQNRVVNFRPAADPPPPGTFVDVDVTAATPHSLLGCQAGPGARALLPIL